MDEINNTWYKQKDIILASRMRRFLANLIDWLILMVIGFLEDLFEKENVEFVSGFYLLLCLCSLAVIIYQIVLLSKYGQTIGKKLLKIRIVDVKTGENGGFFKNVILRDVVNYIICIIPITITIIIIRFPYYNDFLAIFSISFIISAIVILIYPMIDILFIFSEDRRCLHDRIAGTKVINE